MSFFPAFPGQVGNFSWMLVVIMDALKAVGNHRISGASDVGLYLSGFLL